MVKNLSQINIKEERIIFFDGVCNLCNGFVQFVIRHSKSGTFLFGSLQGNTAKDIITNNSELAALGANMFTIIFVEQGKIYTKSDAALRILRKLNGIWPISYVLIVIPAFVRNFVYDFISRNRYRFFGKKEECMIPNEAVSNLFLD